MKKVKMPWALAASTRNVQKGPRIFICPFIAPVKTGWQKIIP
ncbi:MAG: hypothetical protein ACOC1X_01430 [Promethearchaeota archaeon]